MARELQHVLIRKFAGLGLAGAAAHEPLNQDQSGYGTFLKTAQNIHAPSDRLTSKDAGYFVQASEPPGLGSTFDWTFLAYNNPAAGNSDQFGFIGGKAFSQGDMSGTWTQMNLPGVAISLSETVKWHGTQYWDWTLMANGVDPPLMYLGILADPLQVWLPPRAPTAPILAPDLTAGPFSGAYQYAYRYRRSIDGALSPTSERAPYTIVDGTSIQVDGVGGRSDFDKVQILRTVDQGGTLQLLTEIESPGDGVGWSHVDSAADSTLTALDTQTEGALGNEDLQFTMVAAYGDVVYVSGITEEGVRASTRVRMCFPGQPWRFDALDYTDDIDGEVVALAPGNEGVYAFTVDGCYLLQPVGNRAVISTRLDIPGTYGRFSAVGAQGRVYWVNAYDVFAMERPNEFFSISDPREKGSSVEPLIQQAQQIDQVFLAYHNDLRYLLVGLPLNVGVHFDNVLAFDTHRNTWWQMTYGGSYMVAFAREYAVRQTNLVLLGAIGGETWQMFSGAQHGNGQMRYSVQAGPHYFGAANKKRFRRLLLDVERSSFGYVDLSFQNERPESRKTIRFEAPVATGKQINVDFIVNEDTLGEALTEATNCMVVSCTGRAGYFELIGEGELSVTAMTISMQVGPDA